MAELTVGDDQDYATIGAAIAAAQSGDSIAIQAGRYLEEPLHITTTLSLRGNGGLVVLIGRGLPDGAAILSAGAPGVVITLDGFALDGSACPDADGLHYTGGTLKLRQSLLFGSRHGLIGDDDPAGIIEVTHSEFGPDAQYNVSVGTIYSFILEDSFVHDSGTGDEITSRAVINVIRGNRVFDHEGVAALSINLPNGGDSLIENNTIQHSGNASTPILISYGDAADLHSNNRLAVRTNLLINDKGFGPALWNRSLAVAEFSDNAGYGFNTLLVMGPVTSRNTTVLDARPPLDPTPLVPLPPSRLEINIAEDAFEGDAEFTLTIDGVQVNGVHTARVAMSSGKTEVFTFEVAPGPHRIGVTFTNDRYGGAAERDRNLFVLGATLDGVAVPHSTAYMLANGTFEFDC